MEGAPMWRPKTAAVVLAAAATTGAALAAPALLDSTPGFMLSTQSGESVSKADRQQALNVVLAWHLNGPYSECLAERGYDIPWQSFIHLAPGLSDDPSLVELEAHLSVSEGDEDPVSLTEGFGIASHRCRSVNPATDREWMTGNDVDDWEAVLAEARTYGWSPNDPFALN